MISMRSDFDCLRVAAANLLFRTIGASTERTYEAINTQPGWWPACDLHDSPTRAIKWLDKISGKAHGVVDGSEPHIALVHVGSILGYHWVFVDGEVWHSGKGLTREPIPGEWTVVLRIGQGGGSLPWYWRLWGKLVDWI